MRNSGGCCVERSRLGRRDRLQLLRRTLLLLVGRPHRIGRLDSQWHGAAPVESANNGASALGATLGTGHCATLARGSRWATLVGRPRCQPVPPRQAWGSCRCEQPHPTEAGDLVISHRSRVVTPGSEHSVIRQIYNGGGINLADPTVSVTPWIVAALAKPLCVCVCVFCRSLGTLHRSCARISALSTKGLRLSRLLNFIPFLSRVTADRC